MNEIEATKNIDESNTKKKKKERNHKKISRRKENTETKNILNSEEITNCNRNGEDNCVKIGEKGDNIDQSFNNTVTLKELDEAKLVTQLSNNAIGLNNDIREQISNEQNHLSPFTWQEDLDIENINNITRSQSTYHLNTNQIPMQGSSSVPDLAGDNKSNSGYSAITVTSFNRLYQPPVKRSLHSTFSLKVNKDDNSNVAEAQLQAELHSELLKYFPEKIAKIMIITWNMAGVSTYPELLTDLIGNNNSEEMSDLYFLCFQESTSNKQELLSRVQMSVGGHYVIYSHVENGSIFGILLGHKKFIWNLALIGKGTLSTRVTSVTKGVAAISFQFFGNTILLLGSHFSSDRGRNVLRVEDYNSILYSKELIKSLTNPEMKVGPDETNLSHYFDYTFWSGDLNFRIIRDDVTVLRLILSEKECNDGLAFEELLEYDELINSQAAGLVFQEFEEGRIMFLPTYRFVIQTDEYNDKRTPSYTDRILFRSHKCRGIECVYYNSVGSYQYSDHKPVCAVMEINLEPQRSEHLKSAGNFNKEIYNKCFDVCDTKQTKTVSNKSNAVPQSHVCSIQ